MIARIMLAVLICCAFVATSASDAKAQETGTLITRKSAQVHGSSTTNARQTMQAFANCLVDRHHNRIVSLTGLRVDSREYASGMRGLFDEMGDLCLTGGDLEFNETILRGSLFHALYLRAHGNREPLGFAPELESGYRALYVEPVADEGRMAIALESFGECVSRADGPNVHRLLTMVPDSRGERDAFRLLQPRLDGCIPQGVELRFSRVTLKGALAEGMYRLSRAALSQAEQ